MKPIKHYEATRVKPPAHEAKRLAGELKEIVGIAQRELIRANVIAGPERPDWKLKEGNIPLHSDNFERAEAERATVVWYGAATVNAKVKELLKGRVRGVIKHRGLVYSVERESRYLAYSARGHFCSAISRDGLSLFEIAEVLGEVPNIPDKTSDRWKTERDRARRKVQQRIRRFRADNPEA